MKYTQYNVASVRSINVRTQHYIVLYYYTQRLLKWLVWKQLYFAQIPKTNAQTIFLPKYTTYENYNVAWNVSPRHNHIRFRAGK
jgi:hypothetical protein